jgi:hypothetical protein
MQTGIKCPELPRNMARQGRNLPLLKTLMLGNEQICNFKRDGFATLSYTFMTVVAVVWSILPTLRPALI